jgi:hypothetical protein
MTEEDSKELANAGSFGIHLNFETKRPLSAQELSDVVGKGLMAIGKVLSTEEGLLGHVKAFIKTSDGFIKVNLVDLDIGYDMEDSLAGRKVSHGTMNIMAAVIGSKDEVVKAAISEAINAMSKSFKVISEPQKKGATGIISLG